MAIFDRILFDKSSDIKVGGNIITIDQRRIEEAVEEYRRGERALILVEHTDGFRLFPERNRLVDLQIEGSDISRKVPLEETKELKESPSCLNKKAITAFLDLLELKTTNEEG